MPCYLFTWHAYGTWMPDRDRGYVKRNRGILPRDDDMARRYRENQKEPTVRFDHDIQRALIEAARKTETFIDSTVHCVATDSTHIHVLVSWKHDRSWTSMRTSVRQAVTRSLNAKFAKCAWLSAGSSRKQVKDRDHFNYLIDEYLPSHRGLFFVRDVDAKRARRERTESD